MEQQRFLDTTVTIRVPHDAGSDGISVIESVAPHGDSPPLHVHRTEDEVFHVLAGELRFRVGDEEVVVRAGETVLAPKGVSHTYRVDSAEARWLVITTGGDFESLVRAAPAKEALPVECAARGIELVGPPLGAKSAHSGDTRDTVSAVA